MAYGVKVRSKPVGGLRSAETDIAAGARQVRDKTPHLACERKVLSIACDVEPQHRTRRMRRRQGVKQRQDGRRPDPPAEKRHGPLAGPQDKAPARRADLENLAHPHMVPYV